MSWLFVLLCLCLPSLPLHRNSRNMDPRMFWKVHGYMAPQLAKLAVKILNLPATSGAAERCWSPYDFIHNKRRNRLRKDRAEKLVAIFSNCRLLRKVRSTFWEAKEVDKDEVFTSESSSSSSSSGESDAMDEEDNDE